MIWVTIIGLIIEIVKLLLSLRKEKDSPALNHEFDELRAHYKVHREKAALERFRDRLRKRREECGL